MSDLTREIIIPQLKPARKVELHENLRDMLDYMARSFGKDDAYIIKTKRETKSEPAKYGHITFTQLRRDVTDLGTAFLNMGFAGKRLAIVGKNRYEWMLGYYAHICGLGIVVPLDKDLKFEELETSLIRSKADILLFDPSHAELVRQLERSGRTSVRLFICMSPLEGYPDLHAILRRGRGASSADKEIYNTLPIDKDGISHILFTSGTSGLAKAVMLSHFNITHNCWSVLSVEDLRHGDVNMAFLPYHHTFGLTGQTMMSCAGMTTVFCDGLKYVQKNMVEYKVSVFICVPLLIEAMYKRIMAAVKKQGKEKTFRTGVRITGLLDRFGIDMHRKIFAEVLDQLGGGLRYIVSGASPLDPLVAKGFEDIGVKVVQGYGLTETSPVLSAEAPGHVRYGSIGKAIPGVDLKIVDVNEEGIGELVARGPNVMLGYYEDEAATKEIMEGEWLHTGDLASADKDGFITIRGRKKNVIVLKNGKNVYPEEIEVLIDNLPYVSECMVYGGQSRRGETDDIVVTARVVYDRDYMKNIYGAETPEAIKTIMDKDIDVINGSLPRYKQILRREFTDEPMEKTSTGKVKRYKQKVNG